jgi:hypothetical protein
VRARCPPSFTREPRRSVTVCGVLGLPTGVTACLFHLDGVLTQTAKVHAAASHGADVVVVADLAELLDGR